MKLGIPQPLLSRRANALIRRFLPFVAWFPITRATLYGDIVAGVTVGLVLVPQSLAYAQLAGMPPYYGLYASLLPVFVGALWGSSRQLATGPVAMVSLLTGATLAQFATPASPHFIVLAIMLALMVGVFQLAMGVFRLGAIVNFLSHPVVLGFTNAAAIIIGLSQLNKILGVSVSRSERFIYDIWDVLQQVGDTHLPTLAIGISAFAIMFAFRKFLPRWPGVLIAVALATVLSWAIGFERVDRAPADSIADLEIHALARQVIAGDALIEQLEAGMAQKRDALYQLAQSEPRNHRSELALAYAIDTLRLEIQDVERENRVRGRALRKFVVVRAQPPGETESRLYLPDKIPAGASRTGERWRIQRIAEGELRLSGGGEVVGKIPEGFPDLQVPEFSWENFTLLFSTAFVITLVGFMEAISIAKAMATKTRQRIDPNQELIGQGLANIVGSFSQAFPVSGSFSRSAVNMSAGAATGVSSLVTGVLVVLTLLFLTPLLYHLPQAVLAAVIMLAVVSLINLGALKHAWQAHRHDGIAAVATFVATLAFAPHLDVGILVGAGLAIVLYLYRTMKPRVAILSRHADGTLRNAALHDLPLSEFIIALRFDGQLYFANVPYFEDALLEAVAAHPRAKHLLIVGDGINQLDASGEEVIRHLVQRLRDAGINIVFSGLKLPVTQVMRNTGLYEFVGEENMFRTEDHAIDALFRRIDDPEFNPATCPLRRI